MLQLMFSQQDSVHRCSGTKEINVDLWLLVVSKKKKQFSNGQGIYFISENRNGHPQYLKCIACLCSTEESVEEIIYSKYLIHWIAAIFCWWFAQEQSIQFINYWKWFANLFRKLISPLWTAWQQFVVNICYFNNSEIQRVLVNYIRCKVQLFSCAWIT